MGRIKVPSDYNERTVFGRAVRAAREAQGMGVKELARKIHEAPSWIEGIEIGSVRLYRGDVDAFLARLPALRRKLAKEGFDPANAVTGVAK